MSETRKPIVGDIVQFKTANGGVLAGLVTAVHNDTCVNLYVFGADQLGSSGYVTSVSEGDGVSQWRNTNPTNPPPPRP